MLRRRPSTIDEACSKYRGVMQNQPHQGAARGDGASTRPAGSARGERAAEDALHVAEHRAGHMRKSRRPGARVSTRTKRCATLERGCVATNGPHDRETATHLLALALRHHLCQVARERRLHDRQAFYTQLQSADLHTRSLNLKLCMRSAFRVMELVMYDS
jgi:hypothetical protein